MITIMC